MGQYTSSEVLMHLPVDPAQKISRILRQLERSRRRYMDEQLDALGLQGDMYLFLMNVSRQPGLCQDAVAKELMMDKGNAARMAQTLVKLGYLSRNACDTDKRRYRLTLTEAGDAAVLVIRKVLLAWQNAVIGQIPENEEEKMVEQMGGMLERAQQLLAPDAKEEA